jgi:hypothetical protein
MLSGVVGEKIVFRLAVDFRQNSTIVPTSHLKTNTRVCMAEKMLLLSYYLLFPPTELSIGEVI